jgi:23S rRNA pseudouridine1911/1915/1917 synthase
MPRQALHAFRLGFLHPVSHTAVTFFAPPPLDFCDAMLALGLRYNEITA